MKDALKLAAVILVVIAAAYGFVALQEEKGYGLRPGVPAPAFALRSLAGGTVDLAAFRGKVVLVNFWATWCPPCVEETPALERLNARLGPEGLVLIGIATDDEDGVVRDFVAKYGITYPILRDPGGRVASGSYHTTGYPETFLVGRDGRLLKSFIGPASWDTPEALGYFRTVLGTGAPAPAAATR